MTAAAVDELWRVFWQTGTVQARNAIAEHYLPLVEKVAAKIARRLPPCVEVDDLISAGAFGLLAAIPIFDQRRGLKFETIASWKVRGAILDSLRDFDNATRSLREQYERVQRAAETLYAETGRPPTQHEIATRMKISIAQLTKIQHASRSLSCDSLDREEKHDGCLSDDIEQRRERDAHEVAAEADARRAILAELDDRQATHVASHYFDGLTYREIGASAGLSENVSMHRCQQARRKLRWLRTYAQTRELLCA